ncbi:hypothetical protein BCR42DRAFT_417528 [Absidia repens]|uniref:GSKIP domain-containing protein n=1 Tax=Absidia repens TaxID=90262 RepID=A0A1X2IDX9_9FUNG|nr:hypothetical protein BCR42DRAFT_417528 [Absidia repens]
MRFSSLTEELNSITKDYDYGIVPGSAAVFVKDEIMGIGRLDLTLLEGVIVVIELSDQGYHIASSSPLSNDPATLAAAEQVQSCVDRQIFETMENLLMTASPLFRERFQSTLHDKLHKVQQLQLLEEQQHIGLGQSMENDTLIPTHLGTTTSTVPPSDTTTARTGSYGQQSIAASLSSSMPSSSHNSYDDHYTNESTTNLSSSSFDHNTNPTLDQQDLMDEINQWIH